MHLFLKNVSLFIGGFLLLMFLSEGGHRSADPSGQGEEDPRDSGAHLLSDQVRGPQQGQGSPILSR
jgi:hypothetical protein